MMRGVMSVGSTRRRRREGGREGGRDYLQEHGGMVAQELIMRAGELEEEDDVLKACVADDVVVSGRG